MTRNDARGATPTTAGHWTLNVILHAYLSTWSSASTRSLQLRTSLPGNERSLKTAGPLFSILGVLYRIANLHLAPTNNYLQLTTATTATPCTLGYMQQQGANYIFRNHTTARKWQNTHAPLQLNIDILRKPDVCVCDINPECCQFTGAGPLSCEFPAAVGIQSRTNVGPLIIRHCHSYHGSYANPSGDAVLTKAGCANHQPERASPLLAFF